MMFFNFRGFTPASSFPYFPFVIPEICYRESNDSGNFKCPWIPAYARMTKNEDRTEVEQ